MCLSRLQRVVTAGEGSALVEDAAGRHHRVSLLAYDGALPRPGDWLVVHSGYALAPADPEEASAALEILRDAPRTREGSA